MTLHPSVCTIHGPALGASASVDYILFSRPLFNAQDKA